MKMRTFNKFALLLTIAAATTFTSVSAHPHRSCHHRIVRAVEHALEFQAAVELSKGAFHDIYSLLSTEYAYLGSTPNPNPVTNGAVTGLLVSVQEEGADAITRFGKSLKDLGFTNGQVAVLESEFAAYFVAATNYARVMNLYNVFGSIPDQTGLDPRIEPLSISQDVAAAALIAAATVFGETLGALFGNSEIANQLASSGVLLTQAAQAFRGVLEDSNIFGATPAIPATETSAALTIFDILHSRVAVGA